MLKNQRLEGKHCRSRTDGSSLAISSGFTVFVNSAIVVFGALRVKYLSSSCSSISNIQSKKGSDIKSYLSYHLIYAQFSCHIAQFSLVLDVILFDVTSYFFSWRMISHILYNDKVSLRYELVHALSHDLIWRILGYSTDRSILSYVPVQEMMFGLKKTTNK